VCGIITGAFFGSLGILIGISPAIVAVIGLALMGFSSISMVRYLSHKWHSRIYRYSTAYGVHLLVIAAAITAGVGGIYVAAVLKLSINYSLAFPLALLLAALGIFGSVGLCAACVTMVSSK